MLASQLCVGNGEEGCIPLGLLSEVAVAEDLRGLGRDTESSEEQWAGQGTDSAQGKTSKGNVEVEYRILRGPIGGPRRMQIVRRPAGCRTYTGARRRESRRGSRGR